MRGIKNRYFEGERILYGLNDANLEGITFGEGESPLKEATNITLKNSINRCKQPKLLNFLNSFYDELSKYNLTLNV